MNLRRYGLVAIAVAVVGIVVYLLVFFGTQPTAVRQSGGLTVPGNRVTFAAVDHSGQFGTISGADCLSVFASPTATPLKLMHHL
jgi:hypothetical protein